MILVDCEWYLSGIGIYDLVDLTWQSNRFWRESREPGIGPLCKCALLRKCSSPARLVQSVRDDTTEREIELAG